ncbi:hypothetical protein LCGC14_1513950 [marine sediment metagenome]|uniref:Uncharacterized protein n=1 Tax=marine sediment metagenome TaxID=412755 RepID=A0A0F9M1P5_9ZZZZ|nr:hypothetical protein [Pricia sp.]
MKPDQCTSARAALTGKECSEYPIYCPDCSHALYVGQGKDRNGKLWRWQYNPAVYGPDFLKKNGDFMKRQPAGENHPAWGPFLKWQEGIK